MVKTDYMTIDSLSIKAYDEFYKKNTNLFKTDIRMYWRKATEFKEDYVRKNIYRLR